jgi:uncharacterized membrane protein
MPQLFEEISSYAALALEAIAVVMVAIGAVAAILAGMQQRADERAPFRKQRVIFVTLGAWLILGLEFQLAADVVKTVIAPTWMEIGELGAIAVIRTFLNYFLAKDVERLAALDPEHGGDAVEPRAAAIRDGPRDRSPTEVRDR